MPYSSSRRPLTASHSVCYMGDFLSFHDSNIPENHCLYFNKYNRKKSSEFRNHKCLDYGIGSIFTDYDDIALDILCFK